MKRVAAIAALVELAIIAILLQTEIKDLLFAHPWFFSALCAAPGLVIATVEVMHSREANSLREAANELEGGANRSREEANRLREEANNLRVEANTYRERANTYHEQANRFREEANGERTRANEALARIAEHTKQPPTKAAKNAEKLKPYLGKNAQVTNSDNSVWGAGAEIVEIKDEVVTLFVPSSFSNSTAFAVRVHCDDLEMIEGAAGSPKVRILKRYGADEQLGEIKSWGERHTSTMSTMAPKGPNVLRAEYTKPGSSERKRLDVFESSDGKNSYILMTSSGETRSGDNREISRQFMLFQLELEFEGFRWTGGATGGAKHELYIRTRA